MPPRARMQAALAGDERTQMPSGDAHRLSPRTAAASSPPRAGPKGRQNRPPGLLTCRCGRRDRLIVGPRAMRGGQRTRRSMRGLSPQYTRALSDLERFRGLWGCYVVLVDAGSRLL
jgi:hypothetical protein